MTTCYGISGIGYSPLGNLGLGSNGAFSSYDSYMPAMMGMNGSLFGAGGMYGMYNPVYWGQMQQQLESNQVSHAGNMHEALLNNEVNAAQIANTAAVNKVLVDSDIQRGVMNLYEKVRSGDQEGICKEFDKLKSDILNRYQKEYAAKASNMDISAAANRHIEFVYGNIVTQLAGDGQTHDLITDIKRYGESAMQNGWKQGLRHGHNKMYVDETLNHCFGLAINDKGSKDFDQKIGKATGSIVNILEKGLIGGAAGAGLWTIGNGLVKGFARICSKNWGQAVKFSTKGLRFSGAAGLFIGLIGGAIWKCTNND